MCRALFWTIIYCHGTELCDECGRRYERGLARDRHFFIWHAPQPLWDALMHRHGGCLCPDCFNRKADAAGYRLTWVPIVESLGFPGDRTATTNHWHNESRDWLCMGIPDPEFPDRSEPHVWAVVRDALEAAGYAQPPMDYYPPENFKLPSRSNADAGYSKMDRLAREATPEPGPTATQEEEAG